MERNFAMCVNTLNIVHVLIINISVFLIFREKEKKRCMTHLNERATVALI